MAMTDSELAAFLGIAGKKGADDVIAAIPPVKRKLYDDMARVETELALYVDGLGPKPAGVIICKCGRPHGRMRRR